MLRNYLLKNWEDFIGPPLPDTLQVVPISSCTENYGNDVVLIFINQNTYPEYVMKASRFPVYSFKLKNEFLALKSLNRIQKLTSYIPTPYYMGNFTQNTFFIQGGFSGNSLSMLIKKNGMSKANYNLLNDSIDLLISINTAQVASNKNNLINKDIPKDILSRFENELIHAGINKKKIEELKEDQKQFADKKARFFLHGDYWQTNIIVDENTNRINGVIDWEFSTPESTVPTDIIWFLINLGHCLHLCKNRGTSIPEHFKWAFFTKCEHSELMSMLYRKYIDGVGLDDNLFSILMKVTLLKMSLRELISYGRHTNMDYICLDMLKYLMQNGKSLSVS